MSQNWWLQTITSQTESILIYNFQDYPKSIIISPHELLKSSTNQSEAILSKIFSTIPKSTIMGPNKPLNA